nr:MAG TPA: hypothetical protein [Caudoviricetes sp.]DAJ04860.1 MAG TPA: hypothetical protein [Caudoviricetes sp.]
MKRFSYIVCYQTYFILLYVELFFKIWRKLNE